MGKGELDLNQLELDRWTSERPLSITRS